jgi:glycosyltransferase involved in cell wall biosynthesis
MKPRVNRDLVYIFNLSSDLNSPVLAASLEWVKAFARQAKFVNVYSTHLGEVPTIDNVKFNEIGGGTLLRRVIGILRLITALLSIVRNSKKAIIFHHMSPRTGVLLGPFLRLMKIPQGLWYSHSVASFELQIARHFVNSLFTSSESAIPIKSQKTKYVGHGISTELFQNTNQPDRNKMSITSVGRITSIKNLKLILDELSGLENHIQKQINVEFVGGVQDIEYKKMLEQIAKGYNLKLQFCDFILYSNLSNYYNHKSIYFTGTPKSIDKATLEAAFCGCFIVSENPDALRLTGMENLYGDIEGNRIPSIKDQIRQINKLDFATEGRMRKLISESAILQNDVNTTVKRILQHMENNHE